MDTEKPVFTPGTNVLAYHGPLVYEAKVLKYHGDGSESVDVEEGKTEPLDKNKIPAFLLDRHAYFLHYKGWNPKWDEWVPSERIIEYNNDNLGLSRELRNARKKTVERLDSGKEAKAEAAELRHKRGKKKDASREASVKRQASESDREQYKLNGTGRKRQKVDSDSAYEIMLPFSPKLKCIMVDDWELITKDRKVVDLQSATPVAQILKQYFEYKQAQQSETISRTTSEAINGLRVLFDQTFGLDLLYKFERLQYSELLRTRTVNNGERVQDKRKDKNKDSEKDKIREFEPSRFYGVEHLLRLLITLPGRVAHTPMDAPSVNIMMGQMKELLEYIDDHMAALGSSYMNVSSQYDRVARI